MRAREAEQHKRLARHCVTQRFARHRQVAEFSRTDRRSRGHPPRGLGKRERRAASACRLAKHHKGDASARQRARTEARTERRRSGDDARQRCGPAPAARRARSIMALRLSSAPVRWPEWLAQSTQPAHRSCPTVASPPGADKHAQSVTDPRAHGESHGPAPVGAPGPHGPAQQSPRKAAADADSGRAQRLTLPPRRPSGRARLIMGLWPWRAPVQRSGERLAQSTHPARRSCRHRQIL